MKCYYCMDTGCHYCIVGPSKLSEPTLPNWQPQPKLGSAVPDPQPTLRDMWAMAIFQKINIWADVEKGIKDAYAEADQALLVRIKK
jgi:hypothetical protein